MLCSNILIYAVLPDTQKGMVPFPVWHNMDNLSAKGRSSLISSQKKTQNPSGRIHKRHGYKNGSVI